MKIVLIGGSLDNINMGVCALTTGTIKALKYNYVDSEIIILDYGTKQNTFECFVGDKTYPIKLVNIRFSKKFYLKNNIAYLILLAIIVRIFPLKGLIKYICKWNPYLEHIYTTDLVASIAGGDSFSDIYGIGRFVYVALPQILGIILKKNIFQIPQTFGPFNNRCVRSFARFILKNSKHIYSRDLEGVSKIRDLLNSNDSEKKVNFCYDVGFILDPRKPKRIDIVGGPIKPGLLIGLNVSGLLYNNNAYGNKNNFGLIFDYKMFINNLINYFVTEKGCKILLIPHVFGYKNNSGFDQLACEIIYNKMKDNFKNDIYLAKGIYDQYEIKYIIGMTDFFVGSRMHACIAALSQNIPAVGVAYSNKFLGVMKTIGMEDLVVDARIIDESSAIKKAAFMFNCRNKYHEMLISKMPIVKETILNSFKPINTSN